MRSFWTYLDGLMSCRDIDFEYKGLTLINAQVFFLVLAPWNKFAKKPSLITSQGGSVEITTNKLEQVSTLLVSINKKGRFGVIKAGWH